MDADHLALEQPVDAGVTWKPRLGEFGVKSVLQQKVLLQLLEVFVVQMTPIDCGRVDETGFPAARGRRLIL